MWGSIIGAVVGGIMQNKAANKGAKATQDATAASIAEQQREYDQTRKDQLPWLNAGGGAVGRLSQASTGDMSSFYNSPDYQYTLDQSIKGADRSAAARGGLYSGGHQSDLMSLAHGLAASEYGNWWNRQAGLAGVGQAAASGLGSLGMQMANNNSMSLRDLGQARASAYQQQGQNYSDLANGIGGIYARYHNQNMYGGG